MTDLSINNIDEITMRLVHYFVTIENYQPIVVNGLQNEIWLENPDSHYQVIRINTNYIHNDEQLNFDLFKAKTVVKQIKKKILSLKCNTLNILLNVGENVKIDDVNYKNMEVCAISDIEELSNGTSISSLFPKIVEDQIDATDGMDFFINVTQDINKSTEKKNKLYEKTFKKKTIVITYLIIAICVLVFLLDLAGIINSDYFAMDADSFRKGHYWILLTAAFFHVSIVHILCNMYSLYIIGTELETVIGKVKFSIVYIISAIMGCLLSGVINNGSVSSVGASGAIFGLIGALLYFGYHYRLYLGSMIVSQLVPVVLINLFIGFAIPGIDNWGHIGGLVGGAFAAMIVGIEGKTDKRDSINGIIVTVILAAFLVYMLIK